MSDKPQFKTVSFITVGAITTVSIALVLFLLGLTFMVGFTARGLNAYLKENLGISIQVSSDLDATAVSRIQNDLLHNRYVKNVKYITKSEIKKQLVQDLGDDPEEILGYDPTPSYFDVYLKAKYVNPDSLPAVEKSIKIRGMANEDLVTNIIYSNSDIANATSNLSLLGTVLLVLAIILIVISFTLIRSIIQLNIYSKRFLINTMQLVGATNSFIRRPFVNKMLLCGIVAGVIADIGIILVMVYISKVFPMSINILTVSDMITTYLLVIILGSILSVLATTFSVNRYLRMTSNKLYYI